jgi:hypothetical protein
VSGLMKRQVSWDSCLPVGVSAAGFPGAGGGHDPGFGDFLEPQQQGEGDHGDGGGGQVGDGLAGQDEGGPAQGTARGRGGAGDERLDLGLSRRRINQRPGTATPR